MKVLILVFCLVVQSGLFQATVWSAPQSEMPLPGAPAEYVPGEIIVKLKGGEMAFRDAARVLGSQEVSTAAPVTELGVWRVSVPEGQELERLQELRTLPGVEYAELNHIAYAQETPNDPYYSSQWGLEKINAPAGWDVTHGSETVVIAIVDTGIDGTHPDLSAKVLAGYDYVSSNGIPAQTNSDDNGHGTHVAGIASAITNNGSGVAGTAWNAKLMPVKVLNKDGNGSYIGVASGIEYAADHGAKIINLSLGGVAESETLKESVNYAYNKGCLVVAAAGNGYWDYDPVQGYVFITSPLMYPARYPKAMGVGNTASNDDRNGSSMHGDNLNVMAPGTSIYSTLRGGGYGEKYGTSMSTPFVSGLAALVWACLPNATQDQVRQLIEENAVDLGAPGWDEYYGYGRIDAEATLSQLFTLSSPSVSFLADDQSDPIPGSIDLTLQVNQASGIITWTAAISPEATSWLTVTPSSGTLYGQTTPTVRLEANKDGLAYGKYQSKLIVRGFNGTTTMTTFADVTLHYVPELSRIILVPIFKGSVHAD